MFAAKQPVANKIAICLQSDLADAVIVAEAKKKQAEERWFVYPNVEYVVAERDRTLADYEAAVEAKRLKTTEFRFVALPREDLDDLTGAEEHRATQAMQDEHKANCKRAGIQFNPLSNNPRTYPPALMAAACDHPKLTLEDATRIWNEWGDGEAALIYDAAEQAQLLVK